MARLETGHFGGVCSSFLYAPATARRWVLGANVMPAIPIMKMPEPAQFVLWLVY